MKRILITAPLRQDIDIFEAYQEGLDRLEVPEGFDVSRFFVVNDCPEGRTSPYSKPHTKNW